MSSTLAFLVLGVTLLARWTHAVPFALGSPTVVSQETKAVLGTSPLGHLAFYVVQLATMLILYTGGNTSFNGFPYLASFVAGDRFLPRQLTRRGHRLAFSNGIVVLAAVALALIVVYRAQLNGLVALYAIGVFTGFTMAGSGMVKHHLTAKGEHWRRSVAVNGFSAFLSFTVVVIFAFAKFREGAWLIVVVGPLLYLGLIRTHAEYQREDEALEIGRDRGVRRAAPPPARGGGARGPPGHGHRPGPPVRRARSRPTTCAPSTSTSTRRRPASSSRTGPGSVWPALPLDIIECPDRRLLRAAVELVADATIDGDTECTVLLPRRGYRGGWQRFLHDRTADKIAAILSQVPHVSATIIPFNVPGRVDERVRSYGRSVQQAHRAGALEGGDGASADGGRTGLDRHGRRDSARRAKTLLAADETLAARRGDHAHRRRRASSAGPGGGAGQVGAGPAPRRDAEPRVCRERRLRGTAARLPGPSQDRRDRTRRTARRGGHGRGVGAATRHVEPVLRADPGRSGRPDGRLSRPGTAAGGDLERPGRSR